MGDRTKEVIEMKKEILGVLVCMLFIVSVFPSSSFSLNNGPYVEITWPTDSYETDQFTIILTGFAGSEIPLNEYGYTIEYPGGGIFSEFWPINPPVEYYEFEISVNLVEGEEGNLITVYAKDTQTNQGTDSVTVVYNPGGEDTESPEVVITYPEDGQYFLNPDINLQGYVTDNVGISIFSAYNYWNNEEFEIYTEYFSDPVSSYEFDLSATLKLGVNNIVVIAYDEAENKGQESVEITHSECTHDTPIIADNSGQTRFHGVFVGCDHRGTNQEIRGAESSAEIMHDYLRNTPGWDIDDMELLLGAQATWGNIKTAIARAINRAQPGDEFLFYFCNHGGNQTITDDSGDEPDGFDESLVAADRLVSDDTLAHWLSGFRDCVTITVKLDCCHSGGFADGDTDVQNATNREGDQYGPDHINVEPACGADELTHSNPYRWDDDGDGMVEPGELTELEQHHYEDENGNGQYDVGEEWWWWLDEDGDGEVDEDELVDPLSATWMGDFSKTNFDALEIEASSKGFATTKADRNKDGITTTKEWYEYSINALNIAHYGDNDNDGLIDEDGPDFVENSDGIIQLYKDNDGDGLIDEDPAPPSFAFWYDEPPNKPSKPSGPTDGKTGEEYTYTTSTTDPENDDIFYIFKWDDETISDWLGPYNSGSTCSVTHTWNEIGDYQIKVKSRDRCYAESEWSDPLVVSMPKSKPINTSFLNFLENHPHLFPLLRQLLGL